jgi:hypothetical protein
MTASFPYIDVLALLVASVTAAILTTIWVHRSPSSKLFLPASDQLRPNGSIFHKQRKLGKESDRENSQSCSSLPQPTTTPIRYGDNQGVSEIITELLHLAKERPNHFAQGTSWSEKLIHTAIEKWIDGSITLVLSNRQHFIECGLEDYWSISEYVNGTLKVTAGFLDEMEVELYLSRSPEALAHL